MRAAGPTTSAPTPAGPPNLWAEMDTKSAPSSERSTGIWPIAAQASTWTRTPRRRQRSTTSPTGWTVPTSWFANWQLTRTGSAAGSARRSATASRSRRPRMSTGIVVTGPCRSAEKRTAECSTALQAIGRDAARLARGPVRPVHGLGPTRGEDDLPGAHPDEVGDGVACLFDGRGDDATLLVDASRIGEGAAFEPFADGRAPPLAAKDWTRRGRGSAGSRRGSAGDARAGPVAERPRRELHGNLVAAEPGEQTLHHAAVDRAEHGVFEDHLTERTVLAHDPRRRVVALDPGGEPVGGERVDDGGHRGAHRALRIAGCHLGGE